MNVLQQQPAMASPAALAPPDGLDSPRRQWVVFAVLLGTFLGNLDAAIANTRRAGDRA